MSIEQIQKTMDGYNRMILKICVTFAIAILVVVVGFSSVLIYNTYKSYDYDYPNIENVNVNGDENQLKGAE